MICEFMKRTEFSSLPAEEIAFPRSASEITKYMSNLSIYSKGTPIHIRGCILFNHHLKKKQLENKYNLINDGEKIKFTYLKVPNPFQENVVSFISELPDEFGLKEFIDYDTMYNKSFIEPMKAILSLIGWRTEKRHNN